LVVGGCPLKVSFFLGVGLLVFPSRKVFEMKMKSGIFSKQFGTPQFRKYGVNYEKCIGP
jgi:hypothetical protein